MSKSKHSSFFTIAFSLLTLAVTGQSAKDYFIPPEIYNKASYYMPDRQTGNPTSITKSIFYLKKGSGYEVTDANFFEGQPSSIQTKTIQFTTTEVKMIQEVNTNILGTTNKKTLYKKHVTLLIIPAEKKASSWTTNEGKVLNKCFATWTIINVKGENKKAIKVTRKIEGYKSYYTEYYVKGYGLWKREIVSENGSVQTSDKFHELTYDPIEKGVGIESNESKYSRISKYEKYVLSGERPSDETVQVEYDDRDYRAIIWSEKLSKTSTYTRQEIEKLGFEYIKITVNDSQHITYAYRNCKKNLLLNVTEWYNYKISLDIQWFSSNVKNTIGYLMWCDQ